MWQKSLLFCNTFSVSKVNFKANIVCLKCQVHGVLNGAKYNGVNDSNFETCPSLSTRNYDFSDFVNELEKVHACETYSLNKLLDFWR